jgi:ribosomal protein S18 acetylase RimI-like enzyme
MIMDVKIRPARIADIPAVAQVHLLTSKIAYRGILDQDLLNALSLSGRIALWETRYASMGPQGQLWIQSLGSNIVGFALCDTLDDQVATTTACELKSFYITPNYWGAGLGARLIAHAMQSFKDRGFESMILWTIRKNARARAFYDRLGFCFDGGTRHTRREEAGQTLEYEEVRYVRTL